MTDLTIYAEPDNPALPISEFALDFEPGMAANLCVEGHLRELIEQGFEVAVVKDATAGPRLPEGDGYLAALVNFRFQCGLDHGRGRRTPQGGRPMTAPHHRADLTKRIVPERIQRPGIANPKIDEQGGRKPWHRIRI